MCLNKCTQNGILLALYLQRSGRAQLLEISKELGISEDFLYQVAHKMKKHGLLVSYRGRNGGYELSGNLKIKDIFNALNPYLKNKRTVIGPQSEIRALAKYVRSLRSGLTPLLNKTIKQVNQELINEEVAHRERALETGVVQ